MQQVTHGTSAISTAARGFTINCSHLPVGAQQILSETNIAPGFIIFKYFFPLLEIKVSMELHKEKQFVYLDMQKPCIKS